MSEKLKFSSGNTIVEFSKHGNRLKLNIKDGNRHGNWETEVRFGPDEIQEILELIKDI